MTAPTHVTFAQLVYLLVLTMMGVGLSGMNALLVALGSLLPDMDTEASVVGSTMPPLSRWIERRFGHRTLSHSWLFIVALALVLLPVIWFDGELYVSFLAGYASHPLLDSMTVTGVQIFYPLSTVRCVFPLDVKHPHRYRVQTGSRADYMFGVGCLLACVPSFFVAQQGHEHLIRSAQKNITSAVREYNELSRSSQVAAEVKAYNMTSGEELSGTFPVVGSLDERTLLIEDSTGNLVTVGVEHSAEYVTREILCRRGLTVRTTSTQIDMTNRPLGELGRYLHPGTDHRLFGDLSTDERPFVPGKSKWFSPLTVSSGKISLKFATMEDIRRAGLEDLFVSSGPLTVRMRAPVDGGQLEVGALSAVEDGGSFFRLTFHGKRVELLCAEGDTVRRGETLAREVPPESQAEKIFLIQQQVALLEEERERKMADLDARLHKASIQHEQDSLEAVDARRLVREGYLTEAALGSAEATVAQAGLECRRALQERDAAEADLYVRKLKLFSQLKELRAPPAELRSSVVALVRRVQRSTKGGKELVTFTLQRL
ncbi:MAG: metal-dependent hydrolase [Bacteroidota bacterium]